ncbi:F0F1 ATP synthase subunit A [Coraliomargarita sinensis]|uniref:F0F1 ATP synthase subunit A n=1 Tax=Coraliomargarita sinensis TaxID=2174842 RepID=UPI001E6527AF|nr:F0F1 ATP synthase subunit A [Coraliomargarita sinensis]
MNKLLPTVFVLLASATALNAAGGEVSSHAYQLHEIMGMPITNSMLTTWVIALALILAVRLAVGTPQLIPTKGQAVFESVYSGLESVMEPIVGSKLINKVLPLLICLFLFILINNWSGLLPGVGAFGFKDAEGNLNYFFRPANSDLNTTIALAAIAMLGWLYFVLRYAGIKLLAHDLFGNKAEKDSTPLPLYFFLSLVFLLVGLIEVVSIGIRPLTLSMRLFGNILGGETLLAKIIDMLPWYVPGALPFYLLETLVGLIQALVFTLLTAVYIGLICNHEEEH